MSFFRRKSLFVLLIGIIVFVVLIGYSLTNKNNLSLPEKFIKDGVGWVQNIIHIPVNYSLEIFSNLEDIKHTYEENKILREKLAEYKTLIYDVQELEKENKELQELLDIVHSSRDFEPVVASVISRSPERWLELITINKGSQHGIEENMAVMTVDGMVGKVQSVSNLTATVQLITGFDRLNQISATVSRPRGKNIFGLIEGYDLESESLIFRIIEQSEEELKEDELVVSSNMGGLYPSGLPIGTIKEIKLDQYGLTKTALIEPSAKLFDMSHVIVVKRSLEVNHGVTGEDDKE